MISPDEWIRRRNQHSWFTPFKLTHIFLVLNFAWAKRLVRRQQKKIGISPTLLCSNWITFERICSRIDLKSWRQLCPQSTHLLCMKCASFDKQLLSIWFEMNSFNNCVEIFVTLSIFHFLWLFSLYREIYWFHIWNSMKKNYDQNERRKYRFLTKILEQWYPFRQTIVRQHQNGFCCFYQIKFNFRRFRGSVYLNKKLNVFNIFGK